MWFTNWDTNTIGRLTTTGRVSIFSGPISAPASITGSRYGALWYTNWSTYRKNAPGRSGRSRPKARRPATTRAASSTPSTSRRDRTERCGSPLGARVARTTRSGGSPTVTGVISSYTSKTISEPYAIAVGPDKALWFLNAGNDTVGRITTTGRVTTYGSHLGLWISSSDITAGPDGAMWFTSPVTNTIGRITTPVTPSIFSKTPASGSPGTQVIISGRNLAHATQVSFNGTPAAIISDASTYVVAIVPAEATSGRIAVTTPAGTATSKGWFTVTASSPHGRELT